MLFNSGVEPQYLLIGSGVALLLLAVLYWKMTSAKAVDRFTQSLVLETGKVTLEKWILRTEQRLTQITKRKTSRKFIYFYISISVLSFFGMLKVFNNPAAASVVGAIFFMLPQYVAGVMDDRRTRQIEDQLPVAIRFFKTAFKQSKRMEKGFEVISRKMKAPIGPIFADAHFDLLSGYSQETVFEKMTVAMKSHYGFLFVQILSHTTKNASAVELLEDLANKVEDHLEITREHHASISLERFTFLILVLTPFPLYLLCRVFVPSVQDFLTNYLFGKVVIALTFISFMLWILVDSKMRRVD